MQGKKADSPSEKPTSSESTLTSDSSGSLSPKPTRLQLEPCFTRKKILDQLSLNVKKAYNAYKEANKTAEEEGSTYDGPVLVDIPTSLPSKDWFTAEEIGAVSRNVGPGLRIDAYAKTREIEIHGLASGYRRARACIEVNDAIAQVTRPYRSDEPEYIQHSSDGTYGVNYISAPDVLLGAVGTPNGDALADSPQAPIFACEIEDSNRSLPALIRHVGALFANFPNLNGVVGIKGGKSGNQKWAVLFTVEKNPPTGLSLTTLLDFGPDGLSNLHKTNAEATFALPVPQAGMRPVSGTHGLGLQTAITWTCVADGLDANGNSYDHEIPLALLLTGARAENGAALIVPAGDGARIRLSTMLHRYFAA